MIYPKFINKKSKIGICAPSAGVGHKIEDFEMSIKILEKEGYQVVETKSVRKDNQRSASAKVRAKELDELVIDKSVDMIMCATGGDFMYETLPHINFNHLKDNPKWIMGYSDPTNVLFPLTTKYDIATLYGFNGGSYDEKNMLHQQVNLEYLKGNLIKQKTYKKYQNFIDTINGNDLWNDVRWENENEVDIKGRCIGGCLDCIEKIIGTPFDGTKDFIEKYKEDGIVWYFDIFAMSAFNVYLTLLQFKNAGYFDNCKGVLFGRVAFPNNSDNPTVTYLNAYKKALGKIPVISEMDIGHTVPMMTMINGAIINVKAKDGKGSVQFSLK